MDNTRWLVREYQIKGTLTELKAVSEIISILQKKGYTITSNTPSLIAFENNRLIQLNTSRTRISEGRIIFDQKLDGYCFIYIDKHFYDLLILGITVILFTCIAGWMGLIGSLILSIIVFGFAYFNYKNVVGKEFLNDLKLNPDSNV